MITASALNSKSVKDLGRLADRYGVDRWRSLGKDSLIKAIVRATQKQLKSGQPKTSPMKSSKTNAKLVTNGKSIKNGKHEKHVVELKSKSVPPKTIAPKANAPKANAPKTIAPAPKTIAPAPKTIAPAPKANAPAPKANAPAPKANAPKTTAAKPIASKPIASKAAAAKPVAPKPIVSKPVASKSLPSKPEKSRVVHAAHGTNGKTPVKVKTKTTSPRIQARIELARAQREQHKNLATRSQTNSDVKILNVNGNGHGQKHEIHKSSVRKDRVVLLVRDAYWLQAVWELTRQSVERAQVALAQQWHTAKPVLRLIRLESNNTTSAVEQVAREITIHGGVNTWFLDVADSPKSFRVDIGYVTANGKFFALARSNSVTTPRPGSGDGLENNWSDIANDCEKIYALSGGFSDEPTNGELQEAFEERLGRPMGGPSGSRYGVGADKMFMRRNDFQFDVDAEMIIFGRTRSNARVTLAGNPVKLRPDGTFAARLAMPDRRQVLPIVASSADGVEQQTVVIAVERNTKTMEPMVRESSD